VTLDNAGQLARWTGPDYQERESVLDVGTTDWDSSFSPDGRFLAVGSTNGNISVWDLSRRVLRREFKLGEGRVEPVRFLAQGNRLVVLFRAANHFSEWDLDANREIQSWPAPAHFEAFDVSPDERLGVGMGRTGNVSARNLSEHTITNLPLDNMEGWSVAFSSDGTRLAISSGLGYARVWDTATWQEQATLRGFLEGVISAVFSPDDRRLATGGSKPDEALKLWDVASWQELLTLEGAGSLFYLTAFSPDGNTIGTLSNDRILNVWRPPSWAEINAAEAKEKAEIKQL
jgi:WD40 repeat protein